MKILCLQGSPRKQGNTATVLAWVEEVLSAEGHDIEHVDLYDCEVRACIEDFRCQNVADAPGCVMADDGNGLLDDIQESELVLWASPLFCWGFTAPMKALLDRTVCLVKYEQAEQPVQLLKDKAMALICTAGGPKEGNMDLISNVFSRYIEYQGCRHAGELLIPRCGRPEELGQEVRTEALAFASDLSRALA